MSSTTHETRRSTIAAPVQAPRELVSVPSRAAGRPVVDRRRSLQSGLVFKSLLVMAACLALIGVVAEADNDDTGTGVNDAPPAVFVQTD